jgi:hypothetical protein
MEKLKFSSEEVIGFVEDLIQSNQATQEQQNLYEDFLLFGELKKFNSTYKSLIIMMRKLFEITY